MTTKFNDPNEFDEYARNHGGWCYDNGWSYKNEMFGCSYIGVGSEEPGRINNLRMLRHDNSGQVKILHIRNDRTEEIWSGIVQCAEEFDTMTHAIKPVVNQVRTEVIIKSSSGSAYQ